MSEIKKSQNTKYKQIPNHKLQITNLNLKDLFEILLKFSKVLRGPSGLFVILDIGICNFQTSPF